mgnify:CR=1 FL=1
MIPGLLDDFAVPTMHATKRHMPTKTPNIMPALAPTVKLELAL